MKNKPAKKCRHCTFNTDAGGFCSHLDNPVLVELSSRSRTAILKRGDPINGKELPLWPIIAIAAGVVG